MSAFASVKLPVSLVDEARSSAQTMRRSVASQIEYWATLGRSLEAAGLTAQDSSALIAREDSAPYTISAMASPDAAELNAMKTHVLALAKSGALAHRASAAVAANATKATTAARSSGKSRKAA